MIYFDNCPVCNAPILVTDYDKHATCLQCKNKVFVNEENNY